MAGTFGFAGHVVSVTAAQVCCRRKAAIVVHKRTRVAGLPSDLTQGHCDLNST